MDTFPSLLIVRVERFFGRLCGAEKREELIDGAASRRARSRRRKAAARSPSRSRICTSRPTSPKKRAERRLRHRRRRAARPPCPPRAAASAARRWRSGHWRARCRPRLLLPEAAWLTATRLSAIEVRLEMTFSQLAAKASRLSRRASASRCWRSSVAGAHLRRLPANGGRQQPVAVAEPFVERLLEQLARRATAVMVSWSPPSTSRSSTASSTACWRSVGSFVLGCCGHSLRTVPYVTVRPSNPTCVCDASASAKRPRRS